MIDFITIRIIQHFAMLFLKFSLIYYKVLKDRGVLQVCLLMPYLHLPREMAHLFEPDIRLKVPKINMVLFISKGR